MDLPKLRFVLALGALLGIGLLAAGVLFFGTGLTQTQSVLLGVAMTALVSEIRQAGHLAFRGATDDDPTDPSDTAPSAPADPTKETPR